MLILTRKPGESIYIGDVKVTVVELKGHQVRIGIDAPPEIRIYREEIYVQILDENRKAAEAAMTGEGSLEGLPTHWKGKAAAGGPAQFSDSGGGGDGQSGEEKPKRPGIASLSSFTKPVSSSGVASSHPMPSSSRSVGEVTPVVIMRKRKKTDE